MNNQKKYEEEINEILGQLTLEEKITIIHAAGLFRTGAVERLSIPPVVCSDGPMGVRADFKNDKWISAGTADDFVTYLPSNSALASTWNRELAYEAGQVLGCEARGRGKDVILAPGINIKRSPLCGRNFEYMSEDPYLIEEMTVPFIKGIQENDVAACVKHFAVNSQETDRLMVDTSIDERAFRELYLPGFKRAVQDAGTFSLMGAYNKLWGVHCCENKRLLDELLREEWGFDGAVISDWSAVHKTKETAEVSMDMEMSVTNNFDDYFLAKPLLKEVQEGRIEEKHIDAKVKNILRMMFRLKMIGKEKKNRKPGTYNTCEHRDKVYKVATEAMILLKNEEEMLPLNREKLEKIAVIGCNADTVHANGGGSGEIRALYEISPLMGLKMRLGGNVKVNYAPGYFIPDKKQEEDENWQKDTIDLSTHLKDDTKEQQKIDDLFKQKRADLLEEAINLAKECDQVIFVGGLNHNFDVEGQDRKSMELPYHQDEVISELLKVNPNMIVVIHAGSPINMPWKNQAKAIVWNYFAGMETGAALADVLLGNVNPCGKLAETFPVKYEDSPTGQNGQFGKMGSVSHDESIFIGYRHYEHQNIKPNFCFGHGLSYTKFEYSKLNVEVTETENLTVKVKLSVKNIGKRAGSEIVQLYVGKENSSIERAKKELKEFGKVFLEAREEKEIELLLSEKSFGYYNVEQKGFVTEKGDYQLSIGASSEDIRLQDKVELKNIHFYR